jgi:hypothetical protein
VAASIDIQRSSCLELMQVPLIKRSTYSIVGTVGSHSRSRMLAKTKSGTKVSLSVSAAQKPAGPLSRRRREAEKVRSAVPVKPVRVAKAKAKPALPPSLPKPRMVARQPLNLPQVDPTILRTLRETSATARVLQLVADRGQMHVLLDQTAPWFAERLVPSDVAMGQAARLTRLAKWAGIDYQLSALLERKRAALG